MPMTKSEIDSAVRTFLPGVYRHYKGGLYRAVGLVAHHETREPWVLYLSLARGTLNVRPLRGEDGWETNIYLELVVGSANPLRSTPRFVLVNDSLDGVLPGAS